MTRTRPPSRVSDPLAGSKTMRTLDAALRASRAGQTVVYIDVEAGRQPELDPDDAVDALPPALRAEFRTAQQQHSSDRRR